MPRMQSFTRSALCYFLRDPKTADVCREWVTSVSDPERRALLYSVRLAEDFLELCRMMRDTGEPENRLHADWLEMASRRVNWRKVADVLLNRFTGPEDEQPAPKTRWVIWVS
jgi:hypothetical protein